MHWAAALLLAVQLRVDACESTLFESTGCNWKGSAWRITAEIEDDDWCQGACGLIRDDATSLEECSQGAEGREFLDTLGELVLVSADAVGEDSAAAKQKLLAIFSPIGPVNATCRHPGKEHGWSDKSRTCTSPVALVEGLAECETLCRDHADCMAFEYHVGTWDDCRTAETGCARNIRQDCGAQRRGLEEFSRASVCDRARPAGICER